MAVDDSAPMLVLHAKLRKADNGKTLRIRVRDAILCAGTLDYTGTEEVYDLKLVVPDDVRARCIYPVTADGVEHNVLDVTFSADGTAEESAKVCDFLYIEAVTPLYDNDSSIAYFVDCGDHNTDTLSGRDKLGMSNSVTEQLYGADEVTGCVWGLIDDPTDQYNDPGKSKGIYT